MFVVAIESAAALVFSFFHMLVYHVGILEEKMLAYRCSCYTLKPLSIIALDTAVEVDSNWVTLSLSFSPFARIRRTTILSASRLATL